MPLNVNSLLELQALAFPLIKSLGGPDIAGDYLQPGGEKLLEGAAVLREAAEVLEVAGQDLAADGKLDDLDAIIREAKDVPGAVALLLGGDPPGGE